jgi:outer membrane cobalamin receptor
MEFDAQLSHNRTGEGMVVGTAYRKDAVVSSTLQGNTTRDDIGIYFQRTISRKQFHISNGLRADFYRGYGSFISGGNSIRWRPFKSQPFHILGNWNRGFNLPTFNELFWAEDVFAAPNPDLKPEKSESFDIGGELVNSSWNARITYFRKYIKDMIVWQESYTSSGKKWKPFNNDAALIKGVELFGQFSSKITDISLSATLSNPRNKSQDYYDNYLVFQPRLQTMESMEIKFPPVEFRTSHRYLSRRYTLPANTKWVEPVHICDLSSAVEFPLNSWKIRLSTGIDNLFDEEYSIISESPMPGRGYRVEILFEL